MTAHSNSCLLDELSVEGEMAFLEVLAVDDELDVDLPHALVEGEDVDVGFGERLGRPCAIKPTSV